VTLLFGIGSEGEDSGQVPRKLLLFICFLS